ncbi:PIN domain-containing protein [bacterium]|nr:PIN domain-containing protein [bacterium]
MAADAARILPIDAEVARHWGNLTAKAQLRGILIPASDGLMAATALRHGLCVVTRNTRHFAASGAQIFDPWEEG